MTYALGLLLVRLIIGLGIAIHGSQKLFGWFGGYGITGTGGFMESLGFRPGHIFAMAAGFGEFVGGILTLLGFLGPVGPALIIATMLVAIFTVHIKNGFLAEHKGFEMPLLYIAGALAAAFTPGNTLSLDSAMGIAPFHDGTSIWIVVAAAVVAAVANFLLRRTGPAQGAPT
ncbi:MAG: oxidoreductase [Candidatus Meridianibacter frigidus]|nr:MAG: oxidoreductase [Candidatus Eremiobacteraeota bacterium]